MGLIAALVLLLAIQAVPAATSVPTGPPAAGGPITVGLVRGDRTLQPLARLNSDAWAELAPAGATGPWSLWLLDDPVVKTSPFTARAARAVTATAAVDASPCLPVAGLEAGATPGAAAADPVGLALTGTDARPDLAVVVPLDSELGRSLGARAALAFHRAEDETLTLEAEELPAGFPRFSARRERPVTWTRIVRQGFAQGATKTYYLEGQKDYEGFKGRTDIGRIRTTGHVFVRLTPDRETVDAEVDLSDVDGRQSIFRTPLAIVAWPARAVWLFTVRDLDGTHLELMELAPGSSRPRTVWQGADGCGRGQR
jgi:hypothetical protein